ncbi:hypothetical protein LC612_40970 [Nostoc sp. CHAB 5834]|nr:hypothetical protein [Nostoc sp. CHAB 5834]
MQKNAVFEMELSQDITGPKGVLAFGLALSECLAVVVAIVFFTAVTLAILGLLGEAPIAPTTVRVLSLMATVITALFVGGASQLLLQSLVVALCRGSRYVYWVSRNDCQTGAWAFKSWNYYSGGRQLGFRFMGLECNVEGEPVHAETLDGS